MRFAALVLPAAFLTIYLPDIGHGFIKDDFAWIRRNEVTSPAAFLELFGANMGFYRPLVSATFAADFAVWQLDAFGYGLTNLLLLAAGALLLFSLTRRLGFPPAIALLATSVWAFNFHGINMALLWLSGRTSLLAAMFSLATAYAFVASRYAAAGALCLAALLCKEEAVPLPAVLTAFALIGDRAETWTSELKVVARRTWPLWVALAAYAVLRVRSGAFGPANPPSYYSFSLWPPLVLRNVLEYADRAGTVALAVVLVMVLAIRRKPPQLLPHERSALRLAGLWVVGMYTVTVLLPIRSSLYAVLPSIGSAIAVAACASVARRTDHRRFRVAAAVLLILVIVLIPVYRLRNQRWVELADTSTRVLHSLRRVAAGRSGGTIVLVDDPGERFNLDATFGTLFGDATALFLGEPWNGQIARPSDSLPASSFVLRFEDRDVVPY